MQQWVAVGMFSLACPGSSSRVALLAGLFHILEIWISNGGRIFVIILLIISIGHLRDSNQYNFLLRVCFH